MNGQRSNAIPRSTIIPFPNANLKLVKHTPERKNAVKTSSSQSFMRREVKYLLDAGQFEFMKKRFREYLVPDEYTNSSIRNIYYDTPDFRLIRRSLEKPDYKEKLRVRSYKKVNGDDTIFLELKKKANGIVFKRRILIPEKEAIAFLDEGKPFSEDGQVQRELEYFRDFYKNLEPKFFLSYDRTAYVAKDDPDIRITFDRNILWRMNDLSLESDPGGTPILSEGEVLMELKIPPAMPLWLVDILTEAKARQVSFSKCGRAYQQYYKNSKMPS